MYVCFPVQMGRPFCLKELRWAKLYGCQIVGVMEKDSRHGAVDFGEQSTAFPWCFHAALRLLRPCLSLRSALQVV